MLKLGDFLGRQHVVPGLNAGDKSSLLAELARRAALALKLDEALVREALESRERLGSTGVGQGVAIPHARVRGLPQAFGLFARLEPAIEYGAIDGKPVDLAFLLLTPETGAGHLQALAAISRLLRDPGTAAALRAAANARELYDTLIA